MKKVITVITALATIAVNANAQTEPGQTTIYPRFGVNISKFAGDYVLVDDYTELSELKARYKFGVTAGVEVKHQITTFVAASAGLLYSMQGTRYDEYERREGNSLTTIKLPSHTLHYLNLPVLAILNIGYSDFSIKAGVQFGFLMKAHTGNGFESTTYNDNSDEDTYTEYVSNTSTDIFRRFDFSIPLAIGYDHDNFSIDLRYNIFLTDNYKYIDHIKNNSISLTFGYGFTL